MESLGAKFMKWKWRISTHKHNRLDECPDELFDGGQTTLKTEEEAVKCINHVRQNSCKSHTSNNSGNAAMNYGECNGLMKIIKNLD
jgi:hypothetical protein